MSLGKRLKGLAPVIAVGVIVVGAVVAERWLVPNGERGTSEPPVTPEVVSKAGPVSAKEPSAATVWSAYHGGPELTGFTASNISEKPGILWQYAAEGPVHQSPVGDERGVYIATLNGTVTALDLRGQKRWSKHLESAPGLDGAKRAERLDAPISCFRSTVFVGSKGGTVYALDAETGNERWTYSVGGPVLGAINFHAPAGSAEPALLYVIKQDDGALHCIDFETGKPVWQGRAIDRCDGSAAVGSGLVVYGSCAAAVHVFTAVDGRLIRSIELGNDCQVASGPALVGEEVYFGSRCGRFLRTDAQTGRTVWTNKDSVKEIFTTPAVGPDVVVFGSDDGGVYALDRKSGKRKWRVEMRGLPTSPVLAGDKVLVGAGGVLHILAVDTGKELWKYEVSDGIASPAVIEGMVVVGSEDGTVMAFK